MSEINPIQSINLNLNSNSELSAKQATGIDFYKLVQEQIGQVNHLQKESGSLADKFERGIEGVELAEVMVAGQKSTVAFQALLQVRNKALSAYQDIMNMPV
ncbi:MAG: flagellar hook-basal body complex protein FliE [Gammaproteobacteria bacterium]|nr:flagellar hook-basal body complex protein FliE [Gammaproteobacteria bacterium]